MGRDELRDRILELFPELGDRKGRRQTYPLCMECHEGEPLLAPTQKGLLRAL